MKHIEKNFDAQEVIEYEAELKKNQLDKDSLADISVHPTMKGKDVYDTVKSFPSFKGLTNIMFEEQGGICCYCGCRLEYPQQPQYIVEHVFPKEKDRTIAGEYENLLLSCKPSKEEEEKRLKAPKKERKKFFHCDKSKGSEIIGITPLQEGCHNYFEYDEFGGVKGADDKVEKDIETLNLDCRWLHDRRQAAIEGEIYDENYNLLPDDELQQRLETIMNKDANGKYTEFCFVIKNVIEGLLEGKHSN